MCGGAPWWRQQPAPRRGVTRSGKPRGEALNQNAIFPTPTKVRAQALLEAEHAVDWEPGVTWCKLHIFISAQSEVAWSWPGSGFRLAGPKEASLQDPEDAKATASQVGAVPGCRCLVSTWCSRHSFHRKPRLADERTPTRMRSSNATHTTPPPLAGKSNKAP